MLPERNLVGAELVFDLVGSQLSPVGRAGCPVLLLQLRLQNGPRLSADVHAGHPRSFFNSRLQQFVAQG
jgi:hypothetical protein